MQENSQNTVDINTQEESNISQKISKNLNWILFAIIGLVTTILFYLFGNDSEIQITKGSRSIFYWVYNQWGHERYSGNWIILIVAAYIILDKFRNNEFANEKPTPSVIGMFVFLFSILAHYVGFRTQFPRISLLSTIPAYWGLIYTIWGWNTAKKLIFPASYALLCFAASLLQDFTMPLRLYSSAIADILLDGFGIKTIREGTTIISYAGGGFKFDVEDACSGLRSLTAIMAITAPYAYYTIKGFWNKWILFICSIPIAILSNSLRIFSLAAIAEWIGTDLAMSLYHDLSGYIVLMFSILLLTGTASLLKKFTKANQNDDGEDDGEDDGDDDDKNNDETKDIDVPDTDSIKSESTTVSKEAEQC